MGRPVDVAYCVDTVGRYGVSPRSYLLRCRDGRYDKRPTWMRYRWDKDERKRSPPHPYSCYLPCYLLP